MKKNHLLFAICQGTGTTILLIVIVLGLCMVVPTFFGIELFNVVSGSMEPSIPVGSLIGVQYEEPADLEASSIIAFEHRGTIVTHRLVQNDRQDQELITKGDANAQNDMEPIPYSNLVGRVRFHIPTIGALFATLSSVPGKLFLIGMAAFGAILNRIGSKNKS